MHSHGVQCNRRNKLILTFGTNDGSPLASPFYITMFPLQQRREITVAICIIPSTKTVRHQTNALLLGAK